MAGNVLRKPRELEPAQGAIHRMGGSPPAAPVPALRKVEPFDRKRLRRRAQGKVALVCAGGGITGAVYEMGCLRALEDLLDRSVMDLDIYVGVSGGAFVASLLAKGVSPREMYDEVWDPRPLGIPAATLFRLGFSDFLKRTTLAPRVLMDAVMTTLRGEGRTLADFAFTLVELFPPGLLTNAGVQEYLHQVYTSRGRSDSWDDLKHELYVVAVDLDSGEALAFGEEGRRDVPLSVAVQASTALPGLYRPVRIGGRDFVDGGVKKTAHINLAIQHGADLVICINPIVPLLNDTTAGPLHGHLANKGVSYVLDQVLRIALHGRMQYGMERYGVEHPEVDILLIEPTRSDLRMFSYNIMRYSARRVVSQHGYRSVLTGFRANHAEYSRVLQRHGIKVTDPHGVPDSPTRERPRTMTGRSLSASLDLLDSRLRRTRRR